eukprot:CAMPEP_0176124718 /NCGR_PEP_ID=MMETSP0120_2-20121206/62895_1 /TAXON_ID=160619 /ORGANISM="Kryptoperidinium foliaceum, Strain CCMP 1326" /LENGTH=41 /DNA_ID= /DNA_START= /DNA_END= /DNA_ORIENTATION=
MMTTDRAISFADVHCRVDSFPTTSSAAKYPVIIKSHLLSLR